MTEVVRVTQAFPVVACWRRLRIGSTQIVHIDPENVKQPCVIHKEVTKELYNRQFTGSVRAAGRFFYQVLTD